MVISVFQLPIFFVHFGKNTQKVYFFKSEQKNIWQLKNKNKKRSESLENCTTSDAETFNVHFPLLFCNKKKVKKYKK